MPTLAAHGAIALAVQLVDKGLRSRVVCLRSFFELFGDLFDADDDFVLFVQTFQFLDGLEKLGQHSALVAQSAAALSRVFLNPISVPLTAVWILSLNSFRFEVALM